MNKILNINLDRINSLPDLMVIDNFDYPDFIKNLFPCNDTDSASMIWNDREYFSQDILVINSNTKISDLYNFNSKNQLKEYLYNLEQWQSENIINVEKLTEVKNLLNEYIGEDLIDLTIDFTKILKYLFEFNNDDYINEKILLNWLEKEKNSSKKILIIDNFSNIKLSKLVGITCKYKIIVLSKNVFVHCDTFQDSEVCSFIYNNELYPIPDAKTFYEWLKYDLKLDLSENEMLKMFQNDIFSYFSFKSKFFS
ncbi:hypothetical protein [Mycoplasma zalophidermidis]|uniref:hypothetical protein n=1 Tax=Mycoplasma zalophidermidis TaxID=398174 RepID=UPI001C103510|nr:hypothetical protein [Mycoplasma zalophidermidis]MBU4689958.1 hypothetical protein [Mycoplasma zalophidermidis]MCR8966874.1 hypothetical protein [Mycoplasma zalophidermidis]